MNLRHLKSFIALAEELSFTRAAKTMHVTQSTLSHQIKTLEDDIGCALFDRNSRTVKLTTAGETLLPGARAILLQLERTLRETARASRGEDLAGRTLSGVFRVLVGSHTFGGGLFPSCLQQFVERNPLVRVIREEASAAAFGSRIISGDYDLGCSDEPAHGLGLLFEPLYQQEMMLTVHRQHALASRTSVNMIELDGLPMVLFGDQFSVRNVVDDAFRISGARPEVLAEINQPAQVINVARRAKVATIVTRLNEETLRGLIQIPLKAPTPMRTLGLVWKGDKDPSPVARAFSEAVRRMVETSNATMPDWLKIDVYLGPPSETKAVLGPAQNPVEIKLNALALAAGDG